MNKRILSIMLVIFLIAIQIYPVTAFGEVEKLFEMDMTDFSASTDSSSSSGVKSSISNATTNIEIFGGSKISLAKNTFKNENGGITEYLVKNLSEDAYNWAQASGRIALNDVSLDNADVTYEFWANVNDGTYKRWRNVASLEFLWENTDGSTGQKQVTLSADTATHRWIALNGSYVNVGEGWHDVAVTKSASTVSGDNTTRDVTFYIDGKKAAEAITVEIPKSATITDIRLLFGQSRTTKESSSTAHNIPMEAKFSGISIYRGLLTQSEMTDICTSEKNNYVQKQAKIVFDMDLSNYDPDKTDGAKGIKNALAESGNTTGIELKGGVREGTSVKTAWFEKGSFVNSEGGEVPYVSMKQTQFSNSVNADTARLFVDNPDWTKSSYTIEAWINPVRTTSNLAYYYSPILAAYGGQTDVRTNSLTDVIRLATFDSYDTWYLGSDTNRKKIEGSDEGWHHVVITRSIVGDNAIHEAYIDGVKHFSASDKTTSVAATEGRAGVVVGSLSSKNWYVCPTINVADVKIYNDALTGNDITLHYNNELAEFSPIENTMGFVDDAGKEVTKLDDRTSVTLEYKTSKDDEVRIIAGCYDAEGSLIEAFSKVVTDSDKIDIDIPVGTALVKGFAWENDTLASVRETVAISFTDGYNPTAVKTDLNFYDSTNGVIGFMSGKTGVYAKATLNSLIPPSGIKAELKLMRNGASVFAETKDVVFDGRNAEVKINLTDGLAKADDKLIFTIYDSERVYATKTLNFEDLSKIVDVLLVAGQSNALGQGGSASQSIRPDDGTVYYNSMSTKLTSNQGWDSALGKTWHDLTGHTVLIVKATWGGTGFPTKPNLETGTMSTSGSSAYGYWNPENTGSKNTAPYDCYTLAKEKYSSAVATIDTNKYTIGDCLYFWNQGENENNSYTPAMYEEAFLELHEKFTNEFGTEETRITYGGIMPVRSSYSKGFPNLKLTGPRIAQYKMAREKDDIIISSNITESWYSDASIKDWFQKEYDGKAYPLGTIPTAWGDIMNTDNVHYKQAAMNEMGEDAALSMYQYLYGTDAPTGIDLVTPNGIKHYQNGDEIILDADGGIPIIPTNVGAEATFSVSGSVASLDANGVLKPNGAISGYSALTVTPTKGSIMTFKVYSGVEDDRITISDIKDNRDAIYCLTTDDNYAYTNKWLDEKLEEYGLVATMGIITVKMNDTGKLTWKEAEDMVATGRWGVANHTKNHDQTGFSSLTEAQLKEEINGGQEILRQHFPSLPIVSMYPPGGITSTLIKKVVNEKHHILRGTSGGNNTLPLTESAMLALKCNGVGQFANATIDNDKMKGWIDSGITDGKLIVEMWHGIGDSDGSSWGGNCPEDVAETHLEYVAQKMNEGKLWVATLDDVATYTIQKLNAKARVLEETENKVVLSLTDDLDDSIYKSELTINFPMPNGYTKATATMGGKSINATVADGKVSVTVKPDMGNITINFVK